MALFRETPKCPICNEEIAKPIIDTESKIIGDNFIRWEHLKHQCKQKMNKYKYSKCDKVVERESNKSWINSYCDTIGNIARLIKIKPVSK